MAEFPFLWFIIIVTNAVIYTWIYNSTKGSILLVALLHGALNIWGAFIPGVSPIADALVNCGGGRDPDYRVGESKSLAPKTGLCGLIMVDDTSRSKIMQSGTEKLAIAPSIRGADAT